MAKVLLVPRVDGVRMFHPEVFANHEQMSLRAVVEMEQQLRSRPDSLLCLATGTTPMRAYELLQQRLASCRERLATTRIVKLDEWGGIAMDDPESCEQYLQRTWIEPFGMQGRYLSFSSEAADPEDECLRVAGELERQGPIDLCILGLGLNGHVGFNEPAEFLHPHAHVAKLSATSMGHAMSVRARTRPTHGLTLGMADILNARRILLMVSGASKRPVVQRLLSGRIATQFPASLLIANPNTVLLCDEEAFAS
jgi:galactosamine-6-phosphate isomerase